ncbi:hypothetical protein BB559_003105 [Furculomyces boomerangus]|uniref:peptidylprolyl isomerase n=2 Tax=Harpellales TaxID=61421 RepID=A0A2T9YNX9_9FUNG|nr:hypothetical protein BB559_003105 [Furculomyces boomerangus]PWA02753.1 hypothetical protein BB558_001099 [Smittium angustum]
MVEQKWTAEQLVSDEVSKKDLVEFLQQNSSNKFLIQNKLNGKVANIAKTSKKPLLISAYNLLFQTQDFRAQDEIDPTSLRKEKAEDNPAPPIASPEIIQDISPKYSKTVTKKGSGSSTPKKGDFVSVFYKGTFEDGKVFDTNIGKKGKSQPLRFKVGTGQVIRGWDEGLMTMKQGEKATLHIQSEWAYGKKGLPAGNIPPNTNLVFEVELVSID